MTEKKKIDSKILIMGLDNAGKTSIVLSLQNTTNILSFCKNKLKPTKNIDRNTFEDELSKFTIWDFGGQEAYRNDHLANFPNTLIGASKLIYAIDVQAPERFELAYNYFERILEMLLKEKYYLDISIFFHKWDPNYEDIDEEAVFNLKQIFLDLIPKTFSFNLFRTSIYTVFRKALHT